MAAWTELPAAGGLPECTALVELAERLEWSAPELVVQYARRALAEGAGASDPHAVRAQALIAAALVRLGRFADAVEPALGALRGAAQAGRPELIQSIQLDLAICSQGLGEPLLGCTILRPVLEDVGARPATRARAVAALVGCTAHVGRRDDIEDSLAEAERLLDADNGLSGDALRMEQALLAVRTAAYCRLYGETEDAVDAARNGLDLLVKLRDPRLEGGRARARLTLELVCALLDEGEVAEAERVAEPVLAQPVRAASAASIGRLLLVVTSRVLVPAGRVEAGRGLLGNATWIGERHGLDWLLADALTAIAHLDEVGGQPAEALRALRSARVAEHRQLRSVESARRQLMTEFGVRVLPPDTVNSLLRNAVLPPMERVDTGGVAAGSPPAHTSAPPGVGEEPSAPADRESQQPADTDEATGLLTREGLSRRLQAVRGGDPPVALTLVRLDPVDTAGSQGPVAADEDAAGAEATVPDTLAALAGRVRDIAPDDAELAQPDGRELAVLLPHTTRDQAEELATTIRESAIESDWLTETSISTGVAQSDPDPVTEEDADSLLTAARERLTTAGWDHPVPSPPQPVSDDTFLSTLEAAADMAGVGYREIRELLAPLLDHPALARSGHSGHVAHGTVPPEPEPDDVPESPHTPDIIIPKEPDSVPPIAPEPEPFPEVPSPPRIPTDPTREPDPERETPDPVTTPTSPDPEPDTASTPTEPDPDPEASGSMWLPAGPNRQPVWSLSSVSVSEGSDRESEPEPDALDSVGDRMDPDRPTMSGLRPVRALRDMDHEPQVSGPVAAADQDHGPGTEVADSVAVSDPDYESGAELAGSGENPGDPDPGPGMGADPEPDPDRDRDLAGAAGDDQHPGMILGPVQGPEPCPPDPPPHTDPLPRRRDRSDKAASIAELLTEALVAYQATTDGPASAFDSEPEPLSRESVPYDHHVQSHSSGQHPEAFVAYPASTDEPVPEPPRYGEPRPRGRHRTPDWDSV